MSHILTGNWAFAIRPILPGDRCFSVLNRPSDYFKPRDRYLASQSWSERVAKTPIWPVRPAKYKCDIPGGGRGLRKALGERTSTACFVRPPHPIGIAALAQRLGRRGAHAPGRPIDPAR